MKVDKIEKDIYEGYIWMSDKAQPRTLIDESYEEELSNCKPPFIVEAQLYAKESGISYSVKCVDGEYIAHKYDVGKLDSDNVVTTECSFLTNRVGYDKDIRNLRLNFIRIWNEQEDDFCLGMKVLQPKELVFVGFEERKEEMK